MESIESRSDTRSLLFDASPDQVFAAINDLARIAAFVATANQQNLERFAVEVQRGKSCA